MECLNVKSEIIDCHVGGKISILSLLIHKDGRRFAVIELMSDKTVILKELQATDNDWYFEFFKEEYFLIDFGLKFSLI